MEKLQFDSGVREYECSTGAVLRFNPTDQNVYARFMEFYKELPALSDEYDKIMKANVVEGEDEELNIELGADILSFDAKIKGNLSDVFGSSNDFDAIFGGGNIMAMTDTGGVALENFLDALLPIIETNAEARQSMMMEKAKAAKEKQAANRAQRRAIQGK